MIIDYASATCIFPPSQQFLPLKIGIRTLDLSSPHLPQFNIFLFAKASLLFGRPIFAVAWTTQVCRMRPRPFQITHRGEQALWAKARAIGECQEAPEDLFEMPDNALTNDVTPQNASIKVRPEAAPEAAPRSYSGHLPMAHIFTKSSRYTTPKVPRSENIQTFCCPVAEISQACQYGPRRKGSRLPFTRFPPMCLREFLLG